MRSHPRSRPFPLPSAHAAKVLGLLALPALWLPAPAHATLGQAALISSGTVVVAQTGQAVTVSPGTPSHASAVQLRATAPAAQSALYRVSNTQLSNETVVSEFLSPSGVVFAVSWRGPVLPDLGSLLGTYFDSFHHAASASRTQRNIGTPLGVQAQDFVLQSSGRMGAFAGYAYVPSLVPAGVDILHVLP